LPFEIAADLSDLSAQTDAFARMHQSVIGREGSSGLSNASSPTTPLQTNRPSSYSSIVSSAARTTSQDQLPATMSGAAKPNVSSVSSSAVDVGQRSSAAGSVIGVYICSLISLAVFFSYLSALTAIFQVELG